MKITPGVVDRCNLIQDGGFIEAAISLLVVPEFQYCLRLVDTEASAARYLYSRITDFQFLIIDPGIGDPVILQ